MPGDIKRKCSILFDKEKRRKKGDIRSFSPSEIELIVSPGVVEDAQ
jgi:hypothetical protein